MDIAQHNHEIHANREAWARKPALRKIYRRFYDEIAAALPSGAQGITVELGSGMGNIKEALPECVTTDIFPNPWLDRVENAYALSFADGAVARMILFDVWHHLEYPGAALREFARVLAPGGAVALFEPAMGLLGRAAYGLFHHEPLGLGLPIRWDIPEDFDPAKQGYYAAQGNCWRLARDFARRPRGRPNATVGAPLAAAPATEGASLAMKQAAAGGTRAPRPAALEGWEISTVKYYPSLAYLMSGGFRGPQLFPDLALPALLAAEKLLAPLPAFTAARMLVVLRRDQQP